MTRKTVSVLGSGLLTLRADGWSIGEDGTLAVTDSTRPDPIIAVFASGAWTSIVDTSALPKDAK